MAEMTLKYTLPEEDADARLAMNGVRWASVVHCMAEYLRGRLRHEELSEAVYEALAKAQEELFEFMAAGGLSLDDIP